VALMSSLVVSFALFFGGMLAVFLGERVFGAGAGRSVATGLGVLLVLLAVAMRALRAKQADAERRPVERMLLVLHLVGVLALVMYFVQSDAWAVPFGLPLERSWPRLAASLGALWPALWLGSALPTLTAEFSYAAVTRAPRLELTRIRDAVWTGLGLAGALVFAFTFAYIGNERDIKHDFAYFRVARASESTKAVVRTMDQPVQVSLFFPPSKEVGEEVSSYFADLQKESKLLELHRYDRDVDVQKAKELGVNVNGTVIISRAAHKEQLIFPLEMDGARTQLRNLDKDVQQRLLKVARPARTVYFVTGHGERSFDTAGESDKRPTLRELRDNLLTPQGYNVRTLGAADGLAQDVPADASVVALIGPQKPLLPEEAQSLLRYFERGGRLFIALEPDNEGVDAHELLDGLGLKFFDKTLASDQVFARRTNQLSDRANIGTTAFSSHSSVTTLGRYGSRAPLIFLGAGHFEQVKTEAKKGLTYDVTVRAHPSTWADLDGNFVFDPPKEQRKGWELAVAVTNSSDAKEGKKNDNKDDKDKKESGRALLVADADIVSDPSIEYSGNPYFALDGMKWLIGEEAIMGEATNENDVPIVHTKNEDKYLFYGTSFAGPMLVLFVGWLATRRRGRGVRKEKHS
jgi:hypothetical protein